eukprot:4065586-Pleurochrysis_carterae.AAC.1
MSLHLLGVQACVRAFELAKLACLRASARARTYVRVYMRVCNLKKHSVKYLQDAACTSADVPDAART